MRPNFTFRKIFLLFSFLIIHSTLCIATVRYVSKTGSSTPPYTSWETAADSIQKCINICVFGDTIYVANGVYEEQVVMIPGLRLEGAGADSCVISLQATFVPAVQVVDSCILKGFKIIVPNSLNTWGIEAIGNIGLITSNKIVNASLGIYVDDSDINIYKNVLSNIKGRGIWVFNSNSVIRQNTIFTDPNSQSMPKGITIEAFTYNYTPLIDSNYIYSNSDGIKIDIGTKPTIRNNVIFLNDDFAIGIWSGGPDSIWIYSNLIISQNASEGLANSIVPNYSSNNFLLGKFNYSGIFAESYNVIKNNTVINSTKGIIKPSGSNPIVKYNDSWNNEVNYGGFTPDSTNLSVNPMIVNADTTQGDLDFRLQMYSPLIDAGDPTILDRDGSRSDIGLYGGPYGWTYTYEDLAPRPPHNVTAAIEEGLVKLTWNKNTEADFSHYRIYRDTVTIVIYDSSKMIAETPDTFYYDQLPPVNHETRFYYVITAFDNQGNQSYPSEEINVLVTGLGEHPPKGYDGYRLLANYPNPFNPSTIIPYRLKERGHVRLSIYDLKGELVRVLVNEWQERGYYEVVFQPNAEDKNRITKLEVPMGKTYSNMSSGMYIYRIQVTDERNIPVFTDSEKMILLK